MPTNPFTDVWHFLTATADDSFANLVRRHGAQAYAEQRTFADDTRENLVVECKTFVGYQDHPMPGLDEHVPSGRHRIAFLVLGQVVIDVAHSKLVAGSLAALRVRIDHELLTRDGVGDLVVHQNFHTVHPFAPRVFGARQQCYTVGMSMSPASRCSVY